MSDNNPKNVEEVKDDDEENPIIGYRHTPKELKELSIKYIKSALKHVESDMNLRLACVNLSYAKTFMTCLIEQTESEN